MKLKSVPYNLDHVSYLKEECQLVDLTQNCLVFNFRVKNVPLYKGMHDFMCKQTRKINVLCNWIFSINSQIETWIIGPKSIWFLLNSFKVKPWVILKTILLIKVSTILIITGIIPDQNEEIVYWRFVLTIKQKNM